MTERKDRLKKLVKVQEQLKALHEMRRAGFLVAASAAEQESADLVQRFDAEGSLSSLFPQLYHRHIAEAADRQARNLESARQEMGLLASATARTNMVERAYRSARRDDDRQKSDRDRLDLIEQKRHRD